MSKYFQSFLSLIKEWRKPKSEASKTIRKNRKARQEGCYQFPRKLSHFNEFLNHIHKHGDDFFEDGIEAGKQGISHTHLPKLALAHSEKWQGYVSNHAAPLLARKETELKNLQEDIDKLQTEKDLEKQRFDEIRNHKKWNRKKFNAPEGYLYSFIAVCMMLADIPLSYNFIRDILDLSMFEDDDLWFLSILSLILILGIACIPFYFKYFFEKYLFPPVEKMRSQFLITKTQGPDGDVHINHRDKAFIKGTWYLRLTLDLALFIIIIALLYYLSSIRSIEVLDQLGKEYALNKEPVRALIRLISIVLPLVGGILLSSGLLKIQNHRFLKKSFKEINRLTERLTSAAENKESLCASIKNLQHWLEWSSSEKFKPSYGDYFMGRFMQGYKQGLEDYSQKSTLYDWAESLRNKELNLSNTKL
jgi:hypothetical protein